MQEPSRKGVRAMFDRIASTYDLTNRVLSLGIDRSWRRKMMRALPDQDGHRVLDVATGTGDVALQLMRQSRVGSVVGLDISEGMLELAKQKVERRNLQHAITLVHGDAQMLPFPDESFDAVTISFGIRNIPDPDKAFKEFFRVLKPGGRLLILEFALPKNVLIRKLYLFYLRNMLPVIGGLISGDREAYAYLNKTIETFDYGAALCARMNHVGFSSEYRSLTFGISALYTAKKTEK